MINGYVSAAFLGSILLIVNVSFSSIESVIMQPNIWLSPPGRKISASCQKCKWSLVVWLTLAESPGASKLGAFSRTIIETSIKQSDWARGRTTYGILSTMTWDIIGLSWDTSWEE